MRAIFFVCALIISISAAMPSFAAAPSSQVKELQNGLVELGYDPGPADGLLGKKTREAIKAYQQDNLQHPDGKYSGLLLFGLQNKLREARKAATPEGQKKKIERERLLALPNVDLTKVLENAKDSKEFERLVYLIGDRFKELPYRLIQKIGSQLNLPAELLQFMTTNLLRNLYYPASPLGVKQFQEDIGAPTTGELTFGQFEEMNRRSVRLKDTPIYLSGWNTRVYSFDGYATVEGTWIIEGERIAFPINKSKISCRRAQKECQIIQANVTVPNIKEKGDSYNLSLNVNTREIISWSEDEIVARSSGECRAVLLTLNLNSHEVFETTRNNETKRCLEGVFTLPRLDKPRIARLVPGFKTTYGFWQERSKITGKYYNSRLRNKMEKLINAMKAQKKHDK